MCLFAVGAVAVLAAGSYLSLRRGPESHTLRSYEYARVGRKDLLEALQIAGTVETRTEQLLAPQAGVLRVAIALGGRVYRGEATSVGLQAVGGSASTSSRRSTSSISWRPG